VTLIERTIMDVALDTGITPSMLFGSSRRSEVVAARREVARRMKNNLNMRICAIARAMHCDESTVRSWLDPQFNKQKYARRRGGTISPEHKKLIRELCDA